MSKSFTLIESNYHITRIFFTNYFIYHIYKSNKRNGSNYLY